MLCRSAPKLHITASGALRPFHLAVAIAMFPVGLFGDRCMKFVTILAATAALAGVTACGQLSPSGQSASAEKGRNTPAHKAQPNAVQASSTGLPVSSGGPNGQGLAGNPN